MFIRGTCLQTSLSGPLGLNLAKGRREQRRRRKGRTPGPRRYSLGSQGELPVIGANPLVAATAEDGVGHARSPRPARGVTSGGAEEKESARHWLGCRWQAGPAGSTHWRCQPLPRTLPLTPGVSPSESLLQPHSVPSKLLCKPLGAGRKLRPPSTAPAVLSTSPCRRGLGRGGGIRPLFGEGARSGGPGTWVAEATAFLSSANQASQTLLPMRFGTASDHGARAGRRQRGSCSQAATPHSCRGRA